MYTRRCDQSRRISRRELPDAQVRRIKLDVDADNIAALALYRDLGYVDGGGGVEGGGGGSGGSGGAGSGGGSGSASGGGVGARFGGWFGGVMRTSVALSKTIG